MSTRSTGRFWPWFVALLLAGTAAAQGVLIWAATHDDAFAIEPDYYRKAVAWDSTMARQRRDLALGWSASAAFERAGMASSLRLTLRDASGAAIDSARVRVSAVHNLRASRPVALALSAIGRGVYAAAMPVQQAGMWELRIEAVARGQVFLPTLRADLPPR